MTRHLAYHCYPVRGNGVWRRNVARLRAHAGLFAGRRLVTVAADRRTDRAADVADALGPGFEVSEVRNDRARRETARFVAMLGHVRKSAGPGDALFVGHAKGVTHPVNDGVTVHRWADILYDVCLGDWPGVAASLAQHPVTGAFLKEAAGFAGSRSAWHYSGGFYWLRCGDLFARDWAACDDRWWGTESYPGLHYAPAEAGCLFHRGGPEMNAYVMGYLRGVVEPAYADWKESRRAT